jgi:hypothetical protein
MPQRESSSDGYQRMSNTSRASNSRASNKSTTSSNSAAMQQMQQQKILYISSGRLHDECVIASYLSDASFGQASQIQNLFLSSVRDGTVEIGIQASFSCDIYQAHYLVNDDGLFSFVICLSSYPSRLAFKMIDEYTPLFIQNLSTQIEGARENALSSQAKSLMTSVVKKYEDVGGVDAIERAKEKLNNVKGVMSENITVMLENQEAAEHVMSMAEEMNTEAMVFKRGTKKLRNKLRCKAYKVCMHYVCMQYVCMQYMFVCMYYVLQMCNHVLSLIYSFL